MFNKIEECIGRTLNTLEIDKLTNLIQTYSIDEIVECFKLYPNKPLNYIIQVLKNKPKLKKFEWLGKEIVNQELTEEDIKEHEDFLKFIEDFRNEKK